MRQAWTLVSVGSGRGTGGGPPAGQMPTGHPPALAFPVYKVKLESVKASTSNPCIYYNVKPQAIIKSVVCRTGQKRQGGVLPQVSQWGKEPGLCTFSPRVFSPPGTDSALALARRKFVSHDTCRDSLGLQERETYIMGHTSDLWRVQSQYMGDSCCPRTQAWSPFPILAQSLVSTPPISTCHPTAGVLGFEAALKGGADCALNNAGEHHSQGDVADVDIASAFQ